MDSLRIFLTQKISEANKAYYDDDDPIMSDAEYDKLYKELLDLEHNTGIVMSNSPTQFVPGTPVGELKKVRHPQPMLSCEKTKKVEEIVRFVDHQNIYLTWKLDGLTLVLRYENHMLVQAVTRGDGEFGEDVTHNIKLFDNIPTKIVYPGTLVVRGEAVMLLNEFERVNELAGGIYDSPRNLAAGTLRRLNTNDSDKRQLSFYAFSLVMPEVQTMSAARTLLDSNGFDIVPGFLITWEPVHFKDNIVDGISRMKQAIPQLAFPMDGLVAEYADLAYGRSLGCTGHHPRCQMALKWEDECKKTVLRDILIDVTRSGVLSFRAQFDPVELDGATVQKATLHNIDIMQKLQLGIGDELEVYRANKVIPAIAGNLTRSGSWQLPTTCPICGGPLILRKEVNTRELVCENQSCRRINVLKHFCSKKAANLSGVADAMLRKLVNGKFVGNPVDFYTKLPQMKAPAVIYKVCTEAGWNRLMDAIEKSRDIEMDRFLVCLDIPMLGSHAGKTISDQYQGDLNRFAQDIQDQADLSEFVGEALARSISNWFDNMQNIMFFNELRCAMRVKKQIPAETVSGTLSGTHICITGTLDGYTRADGDRLIQQAGGIADSSVTRSTDFLVVAAKPGQTKLDKAKKYGTKILTEAEFLAMLKN